VTTINYKMEKKRELGTHFIYLARRKDLTKIDLAMTVIGL